MTSTLDVNANRIAATLGKGKTDALLDPRQGLVRIDPGPRQRAVCQSHQALGDGAFRAKQTGQKYARRFAHTVGDNRAVGQFEIKRGANQFHRDFEQLLRERHQFIRRQAAMALVHRLGQRVGDAGPHPDHGRLVHADPHGNSVRRLETDAADVAG
jgi:hypothetical protein